MAAFYNIIIVTFYGKYVITARAINPCTTSLMQHCLCTHFLRLQMVIVKSECTFEHVVLNLFSITKD